MAFHLHHGKDGNDYPETPDINVTPFIDVILVLLIIFMVAAPLATVDIPLDLPVSSARSESPPGEPIVLSIRADQQWSIGDRGITKDSLGPIIDAQSKGDHNVRIFVRADKTVSYDTLMHAMDALRERGYLKISLVGLEGGSGS